MQHSMALLTPLVQFSRRRLFWTALALLALTACGGADDAASNGTAGTVNQLLSEPGAGTAAQVAATAARPAPEPVPPMPAALSPDGERPLLEAIARSYPFRKQIETKEQTGHVRAIEAARIEAMQEQTAWIQSVQGQAAELEKETAELRAALVAEHAASAKKKTTAGAPAINTFLTGRTIPCSRQ